MCYNYSRHESRAPRYPKEQTVTDRSQTMTPFIKVIIATDEEAFLELPPILNVFSSRRLCN